MKARDGLHLLILIFIVISLTGCNENDDQYLTVSEVWQDAASLEEKRIRVRGLGALRYEPVHPLQIGGCALEPSANAPITGIAMLFEEPSDNEPRREILISESSLMCAGDTCSVTCKPFEPPENTRTLALDSVPATTYEFVGILSVDTREDEVVLVLDQIDIESSRQLMDEQWEPIPTGEFPTLFP